MFQKRNKYIFSYQKKRRAATIKKVLTVILVFLALIIAFFAAFAIYNSKIHIDLTSERNVEVNTPATASQFIEGIGNGRLVEDAHIDTSSVGRKDCTVKIKVGEDIRDYTFQVNVIDTQAPLITVAEGEMNLLIGTPFDALSKAEATDNSKETIPITLEGEYNPNAPGSQVVTLVATDSSGNTSRQNININVVDITNNMPNMTFLTTTGHQAEVKDGILYVDGILIVNKTFGLPESYGSGLDATTEEAFYRMANAAWSQGILLDIVTEYRSYGEQARLYDYYIEVEHQSEENTTATKPGHSEHQSGFAIDANTLNPGFEDTEEGIWLNAHCAEYGFIIRYPADKVDKTGYKFEPWHIRYVGTDLASKLYKDGKWTTLEEYFGIPSYYLN